MVPLPVLDTKAVCPLFVMTTQHEAVWEFATEPLTTLKTPSSPALYEDAADWFGAPPKASETTKKPGLLKAKPNGVVPLEGLSIGALGSPFPSTIYVSIRLHAFSVTT